MKKKLKKSQNFDFSKKWEKNLQHFWNPRTKKHKVP